MTTYGTCIKQAREARRLTQEQLAEQLDISRQAVSKWEADLSKPTREKLDKLSELLDIPPDTWAEIDAQAAAAAQPPDTSRPWKIAAAALAALCVLLAAALTAALWPKEEPEDPPSTDDIQILPLPEEDPAAPADPSEIFPKILPLTVRHDFEFGDCPVGEYDPSLVPFLDDPESLQENELAAFSFEDTSNQPEYGTTFIRIVKVNPHTDDRGTTFYDVYLLYAIPDGAGELDYRIMFRMAEENHYVGTDPGAVTVEPFYNVLGRDGYKVSITVGASGRWTFYLARNPDGTPCLMSTSGQLEADVDEDGQLEIVEPVKNAPIWEIIDTREGEEGAFVYTLSLSPRNEEGYPGALNLSFSPENGGFVVLDSNDVVRARYVLRDGEMVRLPLTDFSALDYPDVVGTEVTFVTEGELTDGLDPDRILPYSEEVSITHRQQAYLALQELYNMTGLKVESCYCAANEYGVIFSLLPDGFNQRGFLQYDFDTRYGGTEQIPSLFIQWKELGNEWSPLSVAEAVKPGAFVEGSEETMLWYYKRMKFFCTGKPLYASYASGGELWLEDGDLFLYTLEETEQGQVLTNLTGPYPDGEVNH